MNLFYRRPLGLILCIMLGGFAFFSFLPDSAKPLCAVLPLIFALFFLIKRFRRAITLIAAFTLALSFLFSHLYFGVWFRAYERFDGEADIEAVVLDVDASFYSSVNMTVQTRSINGAPHSSYKLRIEAPASDTAEIRKGSVISFSGVIEAFEGSSDFDAEAYYTADGFSGKISSTNGIKVIGYEPFIDFEFLREVISRRIIMMSGYDAGSLFTALFTGDRQYLSPNLTLNFTRIGINHVLALSGMHIVMLSAIITKLLSLLRISKKPRLVISSLIIVFYMAMTGFSASVTRAGIMFIIVCALFLFSSSKDTVTSLSVAVFLICAFQPYAIYDIGLWLSAFATLGVIEAGELFRRRKRDRLKNKSFVKRIFRSILLGAVITFFATGATLLLSIACFTGISSMSLISTPVFSFLSEIYIYIGLAALVLGELIPIGHLLSPIYSLTYYLSDLMSKNDFAYFSSEFLAVKIAAVVFTVIFVLFLILNIRRRAVAATVVISLLISVIALSGVMTFSSHSEEKIIYYSNGSVEGLVIKSGGECALFDISTGAYNSRNSIRSAVKKAALASLDKLIFTYYSANLPEKASGAVFSVYTKQLFLPYPENYEERTIAEEVELAVEEAGVDVKYYGAGGKITMGDVSIKQEYKTTYGESTPMSVITILTSKQRIAYISSGALVDKEASVYAEDALLVSDTLIFGCSGKKYKDMYLFDAKHSLVKRIVLSSNNFIFTQAALMYYDANGTEIYHRAREVVISPEAHS